MPPISESLVHQEAPKTFFRWKLFQVHMVVWEDWLIPWLHPPPCNTAPTALAYIDRYGPTPGCAHQSPDTEQS